MATEVGSLVIPIEANTAALNAAAQNIASFGKKFDTTVKKLVKSIDTFGKSIDSISKNMKGMSTATVTSASKAEEALAKQAAKTVILRAETDRLVKTFKATGEAQQLPQMLALVARRLNVLKKMMADGKSTTTEYAERAAKLEVAMKALSAATGQVTKKGQEQNKAMKQEVMAADQASTSVKKLAKDTKNLGDKSEKSKKQVFDLKEQMINLSKSVSVALGPLNGVAARITSITSLANRNTIAIAAMVGGVIALGTMFAKSTKIGITFEKQMNIIENQLRSTGRGATVTSNEMRTFAQKLATDTLESAETVRGALIILGAEAGLNMEQLKSAATSAADLAASGLGSIDIAARRMLRAFADPSSGLEGFKRAGISFLPVQKRIIESLIESGQKSKAFDIILKKLHTRLGGAAVASAKGLAGAIDTLTENMTLFFEVQSQEGGVLIEIADAINRINSTLAEYNDNTATAIASGSTFAFVMSGVIDVLGVLIKNMDIVVSVFTAFLGAKIIKGVMNLIRSLDKVRKAALLTGTAVGFLSKAIWGFLRFAGPLAFFGTLIFAIGSAFLSADKDAQKLIKTQKNMLALRKRLEAGGEIESGDASVIKDANEALMTQAALIADTKNQINALGGAIKSIDLKKAFDPRANIKAFEKNIKNNIDLLDEGIKELVIKGRIEFDDSALAKVEKNIQDLNTSVEIIVTRKGTSEERLNDEKDLEVNQALIAQAVLRKAVIRFTQIQSAGRKDANERDIAALKELRNQLGRVSKASQAIADSPVVFGASPARLISLNKVLNNQLAIYRVMLKDMEKIKDAQKGISDEVDQTHILSVAQKKIISDQNKEWKTTENLVGRVNQFLKDNNQLTFDMSERMSEAAVSAKTFLQKIEDASKARSKEGGLDLVDEDQIKATNRLITSMKIMGLATISLITNADDAQEALTALYAAIAQIDDIQNAAKSFRDFEQSTTLGVEAQLRLAEATLLGGTAVREAIINSQVLAGEYKHQADEIENLSKRLRDLAIAQDAASSAKKSADVTKALNEQVAVLKTQLMFLGETELRQNQINVTIDKTLDLMNRGIKLTEDQAKLEFERVLLIEKLGVEYQLVLDRQADLKSAIEGIGDAIGDSIEDAIVDFDNLGDVIASLEKDILRFITQVLITDPIKRGISTGLAGFTDPTADAEGKGGISSGAGLEDLTAGFFDKLFGTRIDPTEGIENQSDIIDATSTAMTRLQSASNEAASTTATLASANKDVGDAVQALGSKAVITSGKLVTNSRAIDDNTSSVIAFKTAIDAATLSVGSGSPKDVAGAIAGVIGDDKNSFGSGIPTRRPVPPLGQLPQLPDFKASVSIDPSAANETISKLRSDIEAPLRIVVLPPDTNAATKTLSELSRGIEAPLIESPTVNISDATETLASLSQDIVIPITTMPDVIKPIVDVSAATETLSKLSQDIVIPITTMPDVTLPDVTIGEVVIPDVTMPNVVIAEIILPDLDTSSIDKTLDDLTKGVEIPVTVADLNTSGVDKTIGSLTKGVEIPVTVADLDKLLNKSADDFENKLDKLQSALRSEIILPEVDINSATETLDSLSRGIEAPLIESPTVDINGATETLDSLSRGIEAPLIESPTVNISDATKTLDSLTAANRRIEIPVTVPDLDRVLNKSLDDFDDKIDKLQSALRVDDIVPKVDTSAATATLDDLIREFETSIITIPNVVTPDVIMGDVVIPSVDTTAITETLDNLTSDIVIPITTMPDVIKPEIIMPEIIMPEIKVPDIEAPLVDISTATETLDSLSRGIEAPLIESPTVDINGATETLASLSRGIEVPLEIAPIDTSVATGVLDTLTAADRAIEIPVSLIGLQEAKEGLEVFQRGLENIRQDGEELKRLIALKPPTIFTSDNPSGLSMRGVTPQAEEYRDAIKTLLDKYGSVEAASQALQGEVRSAIQQFPLAGNFGSRGVSLPDPAATTEALTRLNTSLVDTASASDRLAIASKNTGDITDDVLGVGATQAGNSLAAESTAIDSVIVSLNAFKTSLDTAALPVGGEIANDNIATPVVNTTTDALVNLNSQIPVLSNNLIRLGNDAGVTAGIISTSLGQGSTNTAASLVLEKTAIDLVNISLAAFKTSLDAAALSAGSEDFSNVMQFPDARNFGGRGSSVVAPQADVGGFTKALDDFLDGAILDPRPGGPHDATGGRPLPSGESTTIGDLADALPFKFTTESMLSLATSTAAASQSNAEFGVVIQTTGTILQSVLAANSVSAGTSLATVAASSTSAGGSLALAKITTDALVASMVELVVATKAAAVAMAAIAAQGASDSAADILSNLAGTALGAAAGGGAGFTPSAGLTAQVATDVATLPFFAHGGEFKIGGKGGVDRNLVQFMGSRGETVKVTPASGQNRGNIKQTLIFNVSGETSETTMNQIAATIGRHTQRVLGKGLA